MDLSRVGLDRLNVEFKDMKSGSMIQRTFAEVVLIDRTNPHSTQMCYTLKNEKVFNDDDFESFKRGCYNYDKNDFFLVGEVRSIDKHQKHVILDNQNSISYNHLIIASGSHHSMVYEFIAGVNTLVDAIRVRKKIPSAFSDAVKSTSKKKMKSSKTNSNDLNFPRKIDNIKKNKINKLRQSDSSNLLNNPNKRLYEVQI